MQKMQLKDPKNIDKDKSKGSILSSKSPNKIRRMQSVPTNLSLLQH